MPSRELFLAEASIVEGMPARYYLDRKREIIDGFGDWLLLVEDDESDCEPLQDIVSTLVFHNNPFFLR